MAGETTRLVIFSPHKGQWMELSEEDKHFDFDGLMVVYFDSSFIPIYAQAEGSSNPISMEELKNYISKK
jgi:hypothetical protein